MMSSHLGTLLSLVAIGHCLGSAWAEKCSSPDEDCSHTACCTTVGHRCYKKNANFSGCRASCTPGIHVGDPVKLLTPWSCELVEKQHNMCSLPHEDCSHTACCATSGHRCYKKNANFSGCRASCTPGINVGDPVKLMTPWSCEPVTKRQDICSLPHEDCLHTECCATLGHRCYKKNDDFSGCRASCTPGLHIGDPVPYRTPWSCELMDKRHPHCADDNSDCIHLGCCKTKGHKCFMKTVGTAFCKTSRPAGWLGHEVRPRHHEGDTSQELEGGNSSGSKSQPLRMDLTATVTLDENSGGPAHSPTLENSRVHAQPAGVAALLHLQSMKLAAVGVSHFIPGLAVLLFQRQQRPQKQIWHVEQNPDSDAQALICVA